VMRRLATSVVISGRSRVYRSYLLALLVFALVLALASPVRMPVIGSEVSPPAETAVAAADVVAVAAADVTAVAAADAAGLVSVSKSTV
jgi:hypothetical protein